MDNLAAADRYIASMDEYEYDIAVGRAIRNLHNVLATLEPDTAIYLPQYMRDMLGDLQDAAAHASKDYPEEVNETPASTGVQWNEEAATASLPF